MTGLFLRALQLKRSLSLSISVRIPSCPIKVPLTAHRYYVPSHIQEHADYITPGIKLFAPKRSRSSQRDLEGDIEKRSGFKLPPLLKSLGMTIETLLAIPELLVCSVAITPTCVQSTYTAVVSFLL